MNDDTGVSAAVFALKPEWADLILSGTKTVEIRRSRMKRMIDRMLIYRTGTGLIVGEARVKGMHAAPPETIWRGYGTESRIPKNLFDEYAKGADRLYAYRLENPIRYGKPKTLSDIGLKRAPQSWCYLPETGAGRAGTCNGRTELIYDITPITFNQLDLLSAGHPQGGFQQTGHMAHLAEPDVDDMDLIGVTRNGVLSAGCLIAWTRGRLGLEGSIWLGPLCALDDPKLLEHMTRGIRLAARRRHAVSVTCWPNIEYQRHDAEGNPIGVPDTMILDAYRSCGWKHQGFDTGYGKVVNRWNWIRTFDGIKDEKTLLASYKPRTRWSVNRAKTSGVQIRELTADDLGMFASIEQKTARRRGFTARDENYYRRFKETFGSRAHFMLAEIHAGELLTRLTAEYDKLAERLDLLRTQYENHPTSRIKRQEDDITRNLTAMEHRLNEARALASRGSVIPAACALFVEHRREIVYLTAGALPEYRSYQAPALLVHEGMLRLCVNSTQPRRFNMYGITGVFNDPDDEGRGVLEFKQGFNGHAEELVGAFILPTSTIRYKLSEAARTIKLLKEAGR